MSNVWRNQSWNSASLHTLVWSMSTLAYLFFPLIEKRNQHENLTRWWFHWNIRLCTCKRKRRKKNVVTWDTYIYISSYDVNWWKKRSHRHHHQHHSNATTEFSFTHTHSLSFDRTFFCIIVELLRFLLTDCSSSTFTRCNRRKNITSFLSCALFRLIVCVHDRVRRIKESEILGQHAVAWSGNFTSSFFLSLSSHLYSKKFSLSCSSNLSDQFSFLHQTTTMMMTSTTPPRHACLHKENSTISFV